MKVTADKLIFISRILRDGSGVQELNEKQNENLRNDNLVDNIYELNVLSLTEQTFIASGFNSYVVKINENN